MKDEDKNNKINNPTEQNNLDQNANLNLLNQDELEKYKINDITISSISYEDIDEKMNRLINLKKGENAEFEIKNDKRVEEEREKEKKVEEELKTEKKEEEKKEEGKKENELIDSEEEEDENKKKESKIKDGFQILDNILNIEHKKKLIDFRKSYF